MINVPLINDVFACGGVYVYRDDAGYISNIGNRRTTCKTDVIAVGRIEELWTRVDDENLLTCLKQTKTPKTWLPRAGIAGSLEKNTLRPSQNLRDGDSQFCVWIRI